MQLTSLLGSTGIVPADAEALRRTAHILRFFGRLGFTQSLEWEPHTTEVIQGETVFGSRWPLGEETLWTLVNRGSRNVTGPQLNVSTNGNGLQYFDCYHGKRLHPAKHFAGSATGMQLSFPIEALGFGCVFATPHRPAANLRRFLLQMAAITVRPLANYNKQWWPLPQTLDPVAKITNASDLNPAGMVLVTGGNYDFKTTGV